MRKSTCIDTLERAPVNDRLDAIEQLLKSIRHDVDIGRGNGDSRRRAFKVKEFSLGAEATCDREEIYRERG